MLYQLVYRGIQIEKEVVILTFLVPKAEFYGITCGEGFILTLFKAPQIQHSQQNCIVVCTAYALKTLCLLPPLPGSAKKHNTP